MGNSGNILVVEDEKDWQDKFKSILEREGYETKIAAGYGEALGELRRKLFDLAVIDLRLILQPHLFRRYKI